MYLARLVLNRQTKQARRDLANPYEMHRTLSWAFAADSADRPAHFLWRLESAHTGGPAMVLVQSAARPQWNAIEQRFPGYLAEVAGKTYELLERLHAGRVLRFRLKANPTVTRDGKRRGLRSEAEQSAWLRRQGERGGFSVMGCTVSRPGFLRARQEGHTVNTITVQVVTYDGYLRVDDPSRFRAASASGLGHARALGLGLLSVAPGGR